MVAFSELSMPLPVTFREGSGGVVRAQAVCGFFGVDALEPASNNEKTRFCGNNGA